MSEKPFPASHRSSERLPVCRPATWERVSRGHGGRGNSFKYSRALRPVKKGKAHNLSVSDYRKPIEQCRNMSLVHIQRPVHYIALVAHCL